MSNRYTTKVAESLKLRGWIDEIQAKALRADNARLTIERDEAKAATDLANLACDRKDAQLATYKAAVEKAKVALESKVDGFNFFFWITAQFPAAQGNLKLIEWRERQIEALHTLSALTGDATPKP